MSYTKHTFIDGSVIYATPFNEMDEQIAAMAEAIAAEENVLISFLNQMNQLIPNLALVNSDHNGSTTLNTINEALITLGAYRTIITNLTNCSISNTAATVANNNSYSATLAAFNEYVLGTVTITMGGTDITSTVYNNETNTISIAAVTGNIVITATAVSSSPSTPGVESIEATLNLNGHVVRVGDSLDSLKQYLTVNATYDDNSSETLSTNDYTLSGSLTLNEGVYDVNEKTITVTYDENITDTFTVRVHNTMTADTVTLPEGYTQLTLIRQNNNVDAYINTQISSYTVDHVEYGVQAVSGISNGTNWHVLSSCYTWYPYFRQGNSGARNFQAKYKSDSSATGLSTWEANTNYIVEGLPTVKINGETVSTITPGSINTDNSYIYILAYNGGTSGGGTASNRGNVRLFYVKMFDDQNQLIHYFIPCKNDSNVVGMYDTIGATFYDSAQSDSVFIAGGNL